MLNLTELDESIKLRCLSRLQTTRHPLIMQMRRKIDLSDYLNPRCKSKSDAFLTKSLNILSRVRKESSNEPNLAGNRLLIGLIKETPIKNMINRVGKTSLAYFSIRRRGHDQLGLLTRQELRDLERFVDDKEQLRLAYKILETRDWRRPDEADRWTIPGKQKLYYLKNLTSKDIRVITRKWEPICVFKAGIIMNPVTSANYFHKVSKLTSTAHKNAILRALHGDVYTNERLFRFGLKDSPLCDRCNETDTLEHRLNECRKVEEITRLLTGKTNRLGNLNERNVLEMRENLLATYKDADLATLTIHAEIVRIVCSTSDLGNPGQIIKRSVETIIAKESNNEVKRELKSLFGL